MVIVNAEEEKLIERLGEYKKKLRISIKGLMTGIEFAKKYVEPVEENSPFSNVIEVIEEIEKKIDEFEIDKASENILLVKCIIKDQEIEQYYPDDISENRWIYLLLSWQKEISSLLSFVEGMCCGISVNFARDLRMQLNNIISCYIKASGKAE